MKTIKLYSNKDKTDLRVNGKKVIKHLNIKELRKLEQDLHFLLQYRI